jgi:hypothetical protein
MAQTGFDKITIKLKGHVKENWGSPFIAGFVVLLLTAAVSLSVGLSFWANALAVYAFYALTVGVILQLVCSVKYRKHNGENG